METQKSTQTTNPLELGKKVGEGGEHSCYLEIYDGKETGNVIKVQHKFGKGWQSSDPEIIQDYIQILTRNGILIQPGLEVLEESNIVRDKTQEKAQYAIKAPYIENIEEATLKFEDLIGKPESRALILEILKMIKAGQTIQANENKIFDPIGSKEIIITFIKSLPKASIFLISRFLPKPLKEYLRSATRGLDGKTGNFVKLKNKIVCIDPGLYDLDNKNGKILDELAKTYHTFTYTTLIEIIMYANSLLDQEDRIDAKEFTNVEIPGSKLKKSIAKILTRQIMLPLFIHQLHYGQKNLQLTEKVGELQ